VPHLLRHGTSVFKVISERPVILPSECRAVSEGAITTYFKRNIKYSYKSVNYRITVIRHIRLVHIMEILMYKVNNFCSTGNSGKNIE
jgi:hypothetical protein